MDAPSIAINALPAAFTLLAIYLAKDKLTAIVESLAKLVEEMKEVRKELGEIAVLRVRVERCEDELGKQNERIHSLELEPVRRVAR